MTKNRIEPDDEELLDSALSVGHKSSHPPASRYANGTSSATRPGTGENPSAADSLFSLHPVRLRALPDAATQTVSADILPGFDARYDIHGEIGKGGIGTVYLARDTELGRDVAIKVLRQEHVRNTLIISRFVEEAQICGQLNHPAILPIHEFGMWSERVPFFVMKHVKGETLDELLSQRPRPGDDPRRFLTLFEQVCQAVAYAHTCGVIHRDLKPSNVMVGRFGEVHVMDWGMAKVLDRPERHLEDHQAPITTIRSREDSSGSVSGSVMGTLAYLAPEQARGEVDKIDERTDVFGLGAMLCEILTGLPPYVAADARALRKAARDADLAAALGRLDSCGAERELVELTRRCLQPERAARPRTAEVLADDVAAYLSSVEQRAEEAHVAAALADERASSTKRAQHLTLVIAGSLLVALLFAGGFFWVRSERDKERASLDSRVLAAVIDVRHLMDVARAAPIGETEGWEIVRTSLNTVRSLFPPGEVDEEVRASVDALESEFETASEQAITAARDLQRDEDMVRRLEEIAVQIEDVKGTFQWVELVTIRKDASDTQAWEAEAWTLRPSFDASPYGRSVDYDSTGYATAFEEYELELTTGSAESVAEAIAETNFPLALAAALDAWAAIERRIDGHSSDWARRLQRIAMAVDEHPWRRKVRELLCAERFDRDALAALVHEATPDDMSETGIALVARELWVDGRSTPEAVELLEASILRYGDSFVIAVQLALAHTHAVEVDWSEALLAWTAASVARKESAGAFLGRARARLALGHLDKAMDLCLVIQEKHEDNAVGYYQAAAVEVARDDLEAAARQYELAIDLEERAIFHDNLAAVYVAQGKPDAAVLEYEKAMEVLGRDWAPLLTRYGLALEQQGELSEAIGAFEHALELEEPERKHFVLSILGETRRRNGDFVAAIEECERAILSRPDFADAHYNLAMVYKDLREFGKAAKKFEDTIACEDPPSADTHNELAAALQYDGQLPRAIEMYGKAIDLRPNWSWPHYNLAILYQEAHPAPLDLALQHATLAVQHAPESARNLNLLGKVLGLKGEEEKAIEALNEAILLRPEWFSPYLNLGYTLMLTGDLRGATEQLQKALDRATGDEKAMALANLGMIALRQGDYVEALSYMEQSNSSGNRNIPLDLFRAFVERGEELEAILEGRNSEDVDALLLAGRLASERRFHAASLQVWRDAFALDPSCAEDLQEGYRYYASRSAAAAAAGEGDGSSELTSTQRAERRIQAVQWLREDLNAFRRLAEEDHDERPGVIAHLREVITGETRLGFDNSLAVIRDPESIERLPDAEREACEALWRDYRSLLEELEQ